MNDKFGISLIILWLVSFLISLGIIGAIIWAAIHFISKYW